MHQPATITTTSPAQVGVIDIAAMDAALEPTYFGSYTDPTPQERARLQEELAALPICAAFFPRAAVATSHAA